MDCENLDQLLARKPEIVTEFPEWLFPRELEEALRASEGTAIAEIAGRDSIAACLAGVDEYPVKTVLPTIAYTGTEFGDWRVPLEKARRLGRILGARGIRVVSPVWVGSPRFWWSLSGRPISQTLSRFGFYTPCLGCHLYLHALRIPLARRIGAPYVISGARERHDERVKLNQVREALDAYVGFAREFDVQLLLPLRHVGDSGRVSEILGEAWGEGEEQLECVLSGNYEDPAGRVAYDPERVRRFFAEFAVPLAKRAVEAYLSGESLDS